MYITREELNQNMYAEIREAIARTDDVADANIARAEDEVKGYLQNRYDTDFLFVQTGTDRSPMIMGLVKDLSEFYIYSLLEQVPESIENRYKEAKTMLEQILGGTLSIPDAPPVLDDEGNTNIITYGVNSKNEY